MAFHPFATPRESWVVKCKKCGQLTACAEKKRGAPPPAETVIVACHLCGEKRRYLPVDIHAGVSGNMEQARRPRRVLVCFVPGDCYCVYALAEDCKTCISPRMFVKKADTLRKILLYLGATRDELARFDYALRSWGQGSAWLTLQPDRKNLLRIRSEFLP